VEIDRIAFVKQQLFDGAIIRVDSHNQVGKVYIGIDFAIYEFQVID